jgi:hypothetical protein
MGEWECTRCPLKFTSMKALGIHILDAHNSYINPPKPKTEDLTIQTIESLRNTKERVYFLYINKPSTKGNDRLLVLEYIKYFEHVLTYIPESQRIVFKDPNGITYDQFMFMTSFETITRCGRKLRQFDEDNYHDENGNIKEEHVCVLASDKVELMRERREKVVHDNIKYI